MVSQRFFFEKIIRQFAVRFVLNLYSKLNSITQTDFVPNFFSAYFGIKLIQSSFKNISSQLENA